MVRLVLFVALALVTTLESTAMAGQQLDVEAPERFAQFALDCVHREHYTGGHWLGSFAVYLVTERGLRR